MSWLVVMLLRGVMCRVILLVMGNTYSEESTLSAPELILKLFNSAFPSTV